MNFHCSKREVNIKVLKVPEIEQKVSDLFPEFRLIALVDLDLVLFF